MFGSLMMFVSGNKVNLPNALKLLGTFCSSERHSGNSARMRAATEISLSTTSILAGAVKVLMIGKKEAVAK